MTRRRFFMKKVLIALALLLALCLASAYAEEAGILGQPFPDFTVTDTQGERIYSVRSAEGSRGGAH